MNHPLPENTPPIPSTRPDILSGNRIFFRSQKVRNPAFLLIPHLVRTGNIFNRDLLWFSHPGNRMKDAESEKLAISHLPAICNHDSYTRNHLQPCINIQATICIQYTRHTRRSSLHLPPPALLQSKKRNSLQPPPGDYRELFLELPAGLEPATCALRMRCSTD